MLQVKKYNPEEGIYLIDKPTGITSFDVIRKLRSKFKVKKMGHSGTLDPLATGLLIVAVGQATKKLTTLIGLSKKYEATILLGVRTTTGDIDGDVVEEKPFDVITAGRINEVLNSLQGIQNLPVPLYSAIKKKGKPLYTYARKGIEVDVPHKNMDIIKLEMVDYRAPYLRIRCVVSSGTYIRSIAEEIGVRLGTVGTIFALRRTQIGTHSVSDALKLSDDIK